MEFPSRGKARAGGHSGIASSPLWEEGVPARLPQIPEPAAAPIPFCVPAPSGGGEQRRASSPVEERGREEPWAGLSRSAPDGVRLRPLLPFGLCPAHFPGVAGHPAGNRPSVSELQSRRQRGPRASSAGERQGTDPPGRRQRAPAAASASLTLGSGSALGCFLELSLSTASAYVCARSSSASCCLEVVSLHRRNGISCSWSLSGQQCPMPLKQPEKSPLPSQILGFSDLSRAPHEVPLSGCHRKWIKETDSAYVRLAKQGGRPDLLKHYTPVVMKSPPAVYAAPDWYSHGANPAGTEKPRSCVSSLPDHMVHREFMADDHHGSSYETRRGPFEFDTKSVWQWEAKDKENAEKKKVKLPPISPKYPSRMPTVSTNKEFSGENKLSFPPMPAQRKSEAVNFSKLISNGYGTDWFQQCTGWEKKIEETSENSEHSEDSEQSESPPASNELKPPFQGCNN